ncbi:MAG: hypothetical protein R3297_07910 [Desulfobulbales bacterium]|nr:hypothetical protein [Desulfobulbales bacterium]
MSDTKTNRFLALTFARLSQAAKRLKIYSRKAAKDERPEVSHLLRAMSASKAVQARRLFNSLIGKVDTSEQYLAAVFEKEVQDILENYAELIDAAAEERPALLHALRQLRAAETRLRSFYSRSNKDVNIAEDAEYFVCRFCGYLSTSSPPEICPICGAAQTEFDTIR